MRGDGENSDSLQPKKKLFGLFGFYETAIRFFFRNVALSAVPYLIHNN